MTGVRYQASGIGKKIKDKGESTVLRAQSTGQNQDKDKRQKSIVINDRF
jgi:hypothetical protein